VGTHQAEGDAVRLLRAIDAEQAHGRVGATVFAFAAARSAGLRPGTERLDGTESAIPTPGPPHG
jgi:hypothetical protein